MLRCAYCTWSSPPSHSRRHVEHDLTMDGSDPILGCRQVGHRPVKLPRRRPRDGRICGQLGLIPISAAKGRRGLSLAGQASAARGLCTSSQFFRCTHPSFQGGKARRHCRSSFRKARAQLLRLTRSDTGTVQATAVFVRDRRGEGGGGRGAQSRGGSQRRITPTLADALWTCISGLVRVVAPRSIPAKALETHTFEGPSSSVCCSRRIRAGPRAGPDIPSCHSIKRAYSTGPKGSGLPPWFSAEGKAS